MKRPLLFVCIAAVAMASFIWGIFAWKDTHPRYPTTAYALKAGYSLEIPIGWPRPDEQSKFVVVENTPDLRDGSLDRFGWNISIFDHGTEGNSEIVLKQLRSGCVKPPRVEAVVFANGVSAKTFTCWMFMGEINQEHRGYVFTAPNGRIYTGWQPMARDWRTKKRYDNLFRAILGSMKF